MTDDIAFDPDRYRIMATMYAALQEQQKGIVGRLASAATMKMAQNFLDRFDDFLIQCRTRPEWATIKEMNIEEFLYYFKLVLERDKEQREKNSFWGLKKKKQP